MVTRRTVIDHDRRTESIVGTPSGRAGMDILDLRGPTRLVRIHDVDDFARPNRYRSKAVRAVERADIEFIELRRNHDWRAEGQAAGGRRLGQELRPLIARIKDFVHHVLFPIGTNCYLRALDRPVLGTQTDLLWRRPGQTVVSRPREIDQISAAAWSVLELTPRDIDISGCRSRRVVHRHPRLVGLRVPARIDREHWVYIGAGH